MHRKCVYVNQRLVGEASTWPEVDALIRAQGLTFLSEPTAIEGPSEFYVSGTLAEQSSVELGNAFDVAERSQHRLRTHPLTADATDDVIE